MYKKLSGIKRIFISGHPEFNIESHKGFLGDADVKLLLNGEVYVEEKLDGKLSSLEFENYILFYEDMRWKHNIRYEYLPDRKMFFDIYDTENKIFLNYADKIKFFKDQGFFFAPLIAKLENPTLDMLIQYIGRKSFFYGGSIEGIVVKNYENQKFGKIIDPRFADSIEVHWTKQKLVPNIIKNRSSENSEYFQQFFSKG